MEELQHEHPESSTSSLLEGIRLEGAPNGSKSGWKGNLGLLQWGEFAMQEAAGGPEP